MLGSDLPSPQNYTYGSSARAKLEPAVGKRRNKACAAGPSAGLGGGLLRPDSSAELSPFGNNSRRYTNLEKIKIAPSHLPQC